MNLMRRDQDNLMKCCECVTTSSPFQFYSSIFINFSDICLDLPVKRSRKQNDMLTDKALLSVDAYYEITCVLYYSSKRQV